MSMILVSVGQSMMALNPSVKFCRARIRSSGLVVDMVFRSRGVKLTYYAKDHRGIGGTIIGSLDNWAFAGLIYSLLVLTD